MSAQPLFSESLLDQPEMETSKSKFYKEDSEESDDDNQPEVTANLSKKQKCNLKRKISNESNKLKKMDFLPNAASTLEPIKTIIKIKRSLNSMKIPMTKIKPILLLIVLKLCLTR